MNTHADKTQENKSQAGVNGVAQKRSGGASKYQFVDNRPEASAQKKLQEMTNNSPQAMRLRSFQAVVYNSPRAKQAAQLQAMANNSPQVKQLKALEEVVGANQQPVQLKHDVFNKSNMIFATKDPARLPSFYFSTDRKDSWRVRQQHSRGPMIEKKGDNVQHYFFGNEKKKNKFYNAAKKNDIKKAMSVERFIVPHTNDYHVEYPVGNMAKAHKSGGKVIPPGDFDYNDEDYEKMATAVKAWKEKEEKNPEFRKKKRKGAYEQTQVENALPAP